MTGPAALTRRDGKAGIVPGSASGLGRDVLPTLADAGAQVVGIDIDERRGQQTAAEARAVGGSVVFQRGDIRSEADIRRAIERCRTEFGHFDLINNNAAIAIEKHLHETNEEDFDAIVSVNLKRTHFASKHAVIAVREGGGGSIVNARSISSVTGDPTLPD